MAPVGVGLTASYAALLSHIQKSQASAVNTLAAFDVAVEQFRVLMIRLDQFKRSKSLIDSADKALIGTPISCVNGVASKWNQESLITADIRQ